MGIEFTVHAASNAAVIVPEATAPSAEIRAIAPGEVRVIRRNGKVTGFDAPKIIVAITPAFAWAWAQAVHSPVAEPPSVQLKIMAKLRQKCSDDGFDYLMTAWQLGRTRMGSCDSRENIP